MGSKKYSLDGQDIRKILTGAAIVATGAALTYISENIAGIDFGSYTPVIVGAWSVIANFVRKLLTDYSKDSTNGQ